MEFSVLMKVVDELSSVLPGARLERVYEGEDAALCFAFRRDRKNLLLLMSPVRILPRIHLVSVKPKTVLSPCAFVQFVKSRLTGAKLASVTLINDDRIAELSFIQRMPVIVSVALHHAGGIHE